MLAVIMTMLSRNDDLSHFLYQSLPGKPIDKALRYIVKRLK